MAPSSFYRFKAAEAARRAELAVTARERALLIAEARSWLEIAKFEERCIRHERRTDEDAAGERINSSVR